MIVIFTHSHVYKGLTKYCEQLETMYLYFHYNTALQSQNTVTVDLKSNHLLPFGYAE